MRFLSGDYRSKEHASVLSVAVRLDDLIEKYDARPELSDILRRARCEVAHLLHSEEQILSRHEALAG